MSEISEMASKPRLLCIWQYDQLAQRQLATGNKLSQNAKIDKSPQTFCTLTSSVEFLVTGS